MDDNALFCSEAIEDIARRGRSPGLGLIIISQRPASINMSVRSQKDLLLTLNTQENADLTAFYTAIKDDERYLTAEQLKQPEAKIKGDLAKIARNLKSEVKNAPKGVAYAYSPDLPIRAFIKFRKRKTYHAGAAVGDPDYVDPETIKVIPYAPSAFHGLVELLQETEEVPEEKSPKGGKAAKSLPAAPTGDYIVLGDKKFVSSAVFTAQLEAKDKEIAEAKAETVAMKKDADDALRIAIDYKQDHETMGRLRAILVDLLMDDFRKNGVPAPIAKAAGIDAPVDLGNPEQLKPLSPGHHDDEVTEIEFDEGTLERKLAVLMKKGFFDTPRTQVDIHHAIYSRWGGKTARENPKNDNARHWRSSQLKPALNKLLFIPYLLLEESRDGYKIRDGAKERLK
jgi:hypothetical protein